VLNVKAMWLNYLSLEAINFTDHLSVQCTLHVNSVKWVNDATDQCLAMTVVMCAVSLITSAMHCNACNTKPFVALRT